LPDVKIDQAKRTEDQQRGVMRDPKNQMFAEACALLKQAEQLHRQFFEPSRESARWEPPVDVFETERELVIITALPGVAPEAVRVEIENDVLIITGTRPLPTGRIVRLEIPYGRFERRIALSNRLQLAARELKNGCLVLTFTKAG
jgi:HSP20 family molecular chaperone IbpA